jgi:chromosome segregation ATPase
MVTKEMTMMTDEVAELRSEIDDLNAQLEELRGELLKAQVDQWEARIDALDVQLHLGSMDARDRVEPLVEQLRNRWLEAKAEVSESGSAAADALRVLLDGLESAMRDVRDAVVESGHVVTR